MTKPIPPVPTPSPLPTEPSQDELLHLAWQRHPLWSRLGTAAEAECLPRWQVERTASAALAAGPEGLQARLGWLLAGSASLEPADADAAAGTATLALPTDELFGLGVTPPGRWQLRATAGQGCTVAWLDAASLAALIDAQPQLAARFAPRRPASATPLMPNAHDALTALSVRSLLQRGPVALTAQASIREAAQHMAAQGVSSLLITEQADAGGALLGILTDRDLRNRVVAAGVSADQPALSVATRQLKSVAATAPVFEAMLLMARHGIHHLPVLDQGRAIGVLSAGRLAEHQASSPLAVAARIHRQGDVPGLASVAAQVGDLQRQLAAAEVSADATGRILTAITDAITVRLIELAQERLGPPPVPYVWVAAGSQARMEQTAKSDQDNCLVLDDAYDLALHGDYFRAFARFVCDGLDACGYVHCPGEMMAMTDTWRQPRRQWLAYFEQWTRQPDPKALMLTCVFFDLRAVQGDAALLEGLRREVLQRTRGNGIFLAFMASNALSHQPALGLFGRLAASRGGEHPGTIDLKHQGIVPIVDLARVYALAGGADAVNTQERLARAVEGGEVSAGASRDLRDALEFLAFLRIRHQARQLAAGERADNYLRPETLSSFERTQLKDAFNVVQTLQSVLSQRYTAGRF